MQKKKIYDRQGITIINKNCLSFLPQPSLPCDGNNRLRGLTVAANGLCLVVCFDHGLLKLFPLGSRPRRIF